LHASLSALRHVVDDLTAVVTVADDGGSSGRLREEFGVLPPGDLRMALAALCGDDEWGQTWAQVLQHRFAGQGDMRGHVTGNLLIVSLWEQLGDHVAALDWVGRLLGAAGRVLPMALTPLVMTAQVKGAEPDRPDDVTTVRGQVAVATSGGQILSVALDPPDPTPCVEAVAAVRDADWVVLGPGSWFTSVIAHLLVPELCRALVETRARVVVVLNLAPQDGETPGFDQADHLAALLEHAPELQVHTVLADVRSVRDHDVLRAAVESAGARLVVADVAADDGAPRHDPSKLAAAYSVVMGPPEHPGIHPRGPQG
jgi:uncharacterized cofD-like protein